MGATCCKTDDGADITAPEPTITGSVKVQRYGEPSPVEVWEARQKELNLLVLEKMREDFYNRPDNFILNLLAVSVQFYKNYTREKVEIANHIRDREQALSTKMEMSKRKILYHGGLEEISGTHILFLPKEEDYMELPTSLQVFVVQDNVDVYGDDQYNELQLRKYADVDGPVYRLCTEYSNRHPGYVRLRCVDIIPGVSRNNTYEDIYAFITPTNEEQPDPVVDPRPLRRNSISSSDDEGLAPRPPLASFSSFEEEEEDSSNDEATPPPPGLMGRRPSGVLPKHYPRRPNGIPGGNIMPSNRLTERRPSGVFPKMNPNMDRLRVTTEQRRKIVSTGNNFSAVQRVLAGIDEASEDEEEEDEVDKPQMKSEVLEETPEPQQEEPMTPKELPRLHSNIRSECFLNRKLKLNVEGDVYGVKARTELRTYFSSERYLECFEDDFETLAQILGKQHLVDKSEVQTPAVLASELMIEGIGPKFNTEFIPTLMLKEWPRCAFEYKFRERKTRADPDTKLTFRWPKPSVVNAVVNSGCHLVPIGHYSPAKPMSAMRIEWQLQFPRAEQLLLRTLGHTQIRVLLLVEFMMRDHLGNVPGLKPQHLRFILYWMCEHNFRDWQEERLGNKLKAYFKTLYNCLSTENLPHYFIDKCNMLEVIPERYLRQMQALVKKMKDNLPMYLMHTMLRMRQEEDFYPQIDVKELYKFLVPKIITIDLLNPNLLGLTGGAAADGNSSDEEGQGKIRKIDTGEDVLYSDEEEEDDFKAKLHALRKQRKIAATRKSVANVPSKRRRSTINLDNHVHCVRDTRAGKILNTFAEHFIKMARSSNKFRSYPQAYMFLLLAGNMATLLEETGNSMEAQSYRREIDELNTASRGGVRDMMGNTWGNNDPYFLGIQSGLKGSNWDLKKEQPLPSPPMQPSPVMGLRMPHKQTLESLSDIENNNKKVTVTNSLSIESSLFENTGARPKSTLSVQSMESVAEKEPNGFVVFSDDDEDNSTDL